MYYSGIKAVAAVLVASMLTIVDPVHAELSRAGVVHSVFLWLKEPGNTQHRHQILRASRQLRTIPGVVDIRYGEAIISDRAIVDDSFDVGIYIYFSDRAAMNRYLVDPRHKRLVEHVLDPVVDRIVVYDFHDLVVR